MAHEEDDSVNSSETTASTSSRFPIHYAWVILIMATLVVFGSLGLARFGYGIVLPDMQAGLGMDNTQAGVLATVNLIGYLALSVLGGALASRFGPRVVITAGLLVAATGMVFTGLANRYTVAAVWRGLTGLGSGASNVPVMALLAAWFSAKRRGFASGIAVAGSSIALILLGPLAPRLLAIDPAAGWRYCWFVFSGATFLLAVAAFAVLRNHPSDVGLSALGEEAQPASPKTRANPLEWGRVYKSGAVWHMGIVYFAFGFSYIIYMTFFVKGLTADGGYTKLAAGRLFMVMGWFSLVCGLLWGAVSDVIGRKRALIIVYLIQATAFSLFALWPTPPGYTVSAILFGLTAWSIPAVMAAACGDQLGSRMAPAGLGFVTLFFGIGQAIAPSVAGLMADAAGSLSPAFLLAAGVAVLGAVAASLLK